MVEGFLYFFIYRFYPSLSFEGGGLGVIGNGYEQTIGTMVSGDGAFVGGGLFAARGPAGRGGRARSLEDGGGGGFGKRGFLG